MAYNLTVTKHERCVNGTRRALQQPEQRGFCWTECACSEDGEECSFGEDCADFTCDSPSFRRKGSEPVCVQDECTR